MTKRYKKLVEILKQQNIMKKVDGVHYKIKKIPDNNLCGEFDPRVYQSVFQQFSEAEGFSFETLINKPLSEIHFDKIREKMGFSNRNITTTHVHVKSKKIDGKYGEIPVQIFSAEHLKENCPCIVYFHGGAFFGGSLKTVYNSCLYLAEQINGVVISVDYRLAPENPFPKGLDDCFTAVEWAYQNSETLKINKSKIIVSGDSAGGNLSAACSILDRDLGTNYISFQALIYPSVNMSNEKVDNYEWKSSDYNMINHHKLIKKSMKDLDDSLHIVRRAYVQGEHSIFNPLICPLFAENFESLPRTLIITGEFDKFRIENEQYAKKLQLAGVEVEVIRYCGMDHGFIDKVGIYPQTEDCLNEIAVRI